MAIGIVSDQEFESELGDSKKESHISVPVIQDIPVRGRKEGDIAVPDSIRQIIGEESLMNGRAAAVKLASDFGISPSSVSAYAVGATSTTTYNQPKKSIADHINRSRERAIKRAGRTLNSALGSITQEKLDYSDAKDLSSIAKEMSVIIRNLEPQQVVQNDGPKSPQFVIFAPQFRREESFEVINVSE